MSVYALHQEKLAFFSPNNSKYAFKVVPFGPINAPEFYTCMMQEFHVEWDLTFILKIRNTIEIGGETVCVTDTNDIYFNNRKTYSGSELVIDDILVYYTNLEIILIYFEYFYKVFEKYWVSFKLDQCEFLKDRVEFVSHYILSGGRFPA